MRLNTVAAEPKERLPEGKWRKSALYGKWKPDRSHDEIWRQGLWCLMRLNTVAAEPKERLPEGKWRKSALYEVRAAAGVQLDLPG
jgi:hypothetical protein